MPHGLTVTDLWLAGVGGLAMLALFVWLEMTGRRSTIVWLVVGEAVLEALLYPNQASIPSPLFYLPLAGRHLRPSEVLIGVALVARALAPTARRQWTTAGAGWAAFFAWYSAAFVVGILNGNPKITALFDIKEALLFFGGTYLLAAGLPLSQIVGRRPVARWVFWLGLAVVLFVPLSRGNHSLNLPLMPLPVLGFGSDVSDCIVALGGLLLGIEICRPRPRPWAVGTSMLLVLSSLMGTQRAAMMVSGGVLGVFALASLSRNWRHRTAFGSRTLRRLAVAVAGLAVVAMAFLAEIGAPNPAVVRIHAALFSTAKAESANARLQIWREAVALIVHQPVFGNGLGIQVPLREVWPLPVIYVPTHDIALDLLMRSGVVGLALFVMAVGLSLREGWRLWHRTTDPLVAGVALGASAGITGLLALGAVESLFDQVRVVIVFGFLLGCLTVAHRHEKARLAEEAIRAHVGSSPEAPVPAQTANASGQLTTVA